MSGPAYVLVDVPTTLYRLYNEAGTLLYVGITNDSTRRLVQHADGQPWWDEVASVTFASHPDRTAAEAAERLAIRTQAPLYNVRHSITERRHRPRRSRGGPKSRAFGDAIRQARLAKGWSKAQLAREIRVVPSFIDQLEAGESGASQQTLITLEAKLDRVGQLGWIIGYGPPPAIASPEVAVQADESLSDNEKRILLATLTEIRQIAAEEGGR
jgi:transcriptional regulator with XRE-family HTH domain